MNIIKQTVLDSAEAPKSLEPATADQRSWNWQTIVTLATGLVLYIGLRIWSLWTPRLWGDEVFTFSLSQGTWIALIKRAGLDMVHPPLFYFLLKLWIYVAGSSMSGLRILTVTFSIAALVPLVALARQLEFRMPVIILTLTLMAVNNYLIVYSYYLRSYSLPLFLALSSQALFARFLRFRSANQTQTLVTLTLINILFVYTHYFAWLVVLAEYLWIVVMDRRHLRQLTISTVIVLLCFIPWVGVIVYVSSQVSYTFLDQIVWYRPPGLSNLLLILRCFNGGFNSESLTLAGSVVFLLIVLGALKYSMSQPHSGRRKDQWTLNSYALLMWLSIFPVVTSYAASKLFTLKWEPRYVIVAAGSYLLLISACAFRLRNPCIRIAAVVFLLGWSFLAGFTDNLAELLHGPNAPSYWLARDLSQREARTTGPISIYGISPYAEQGLRLALNLTGERRFKTITCSPDVELSEDYFWVAVTEHDLVAAARVKDLSSNGSYEMGKPIYAGETPQRHILIPVQRK